MTPKEAHKIARAHAIACPCCGQPLMIGCDPIGDFVDPDLREFKRILDRLRSDGRLVLVSAEEGAEQLHEGKGRMVP